MQHLFLAAVAVLKKYELKLYFSATTTNLTMHLEDVDRMNWSQRLSSKPVETCDRGIQCHVVVVPLLLFEFGRMCWKFAWSLGTESFFAFGSGFYFHHHHQPPTYHHHHPPYNIWPEQCHVLCLVVVVGGAPLFYNILSFWVNWAKGMFLRKIFFWR